MTRKQRRLTLIGLAGVVLATAVGLVLYALSGQIAFFKSPSQIMAERPDPSQRIRVGGLVAIGSVVRDGDSTIRFDVTDGAAAVPVVYHKQVPDLFREGQGVVAEGTVSADGVMAADMVLAKHDERYMPREVVDALKASGRWGEGGALPGTAEESGAAPGAAAADASQ
jgi:cytochrome c-type biogenesis protein CcmE